MDAIILLLAFDLLAFGMGDAGDFALRVALARPERKVIFLKGDFLDGGPMVKQILNNMFKPFPTGGVSDMPGCVGGQRR